MKNLESLSSSRFADLFVRGTRFIDVRAPIEFHAGSIPGAVNLPLLTDEERHQVGLTFKQQGQQAAIELGHRLVSGAVKESRMQAWLEELETHPQAVIFCFRGGLRSQIVQAWLAESGVHRPIIEGGYKALRRFLIEVLETRPRDLKFLVVSGPTGSGKTAYLHASGQPFLDLEEIAAHRGSAFGGMGRQPTQVDFENALAVKLFHLANSSEAILIEDESRRIGQRAIPEVLFLKMNSSPKIRLEVSFEARVENIFRDYILQSILGAERDLQKFADFRRAVTAISRRLGGLRAQEIMHDLNASQSEFEAGRGLESNRIWIRKLLQWYYDPLYK
jgi:tRNA 2-selenouridine synthase